MASVGNVQGSDLHDHRGIGVNCFGGLNVAENFFNDQNGGMTIDWVALAASVLLLAIAVVYGLFTMGVSDLSEVINTTLDDSGSVSTGHVPGPDDMK